MKCWTAYNVSVSVCMWNGSSVSHRVQRQSIIECAYRDSWALKEWVLGTNNENEWPWNRMNSEKRRRGREMEQEKLNGKNALQKKSRPSQNLNEKSHKSVDLITLSTRCDVISIVSCFNSPISIPSVRKFLASLRRPPPSASSLLPNGCTFMPFTWAIYSSIRSLPPSLLLFPTVLCLKSFAGILLGFLFAIFVYNITISFYYIWTVSVGLPLLPLLVLVLLVVVVVVIVTKHIHSIAAQTFPIFFFRKWITWRWTIASPRPGEKANKFQNSPDDNGDRVWW